MYDMQCLKFHTKCQDPVFCCERVSCFIVKLCPCVSRLAFQFLPLCVFPSIQCLTCPSSLHLYLIHLLVCQYVVFVLPHVFVSSFHVLPWCHPVFPTSAIPRVSLWFVSVFMFLEFSFDLYFAFVLHILKALFRCYFVFSPWDVFFVFFWGGWVVSFSFCERHSPFVP